MDELKVKDLMVPLKNYAVVSEDADLAEAVQALNDSQKKFDQNRDQHRAILVLDKDGHVVGKLSQWDVIKGLEPKYSSFKDMPGTSKLGFTEGFIRSLTRDTGLWSRPLGDLCKKAARIRVRDIMYMPAQGEYVREEAPLDEGIHQLIVGRHQSLLVLRDNEIVGVLRLIDVFRTVCEMITACSV